MNTKNIKPFTPPLPFQTERGVHNYMSTPTIYGLLRQLTEETGGPYMEVGSYRGQSLLAAGMNTDIECIGIDNFTGTGKRADNETILLEQISLYPNINLIKDDYKAALADLKKSRKKFGVIFLDGPHGEKETAEQLEFAGKMLKKGGYLIVDDFNDLAVAFAVQSFMHDAKGFEMTFSESTSHRNDKTWWNGVAVIQKK